MRAKRDIAKIILKGLLIAGAIPIAATSPYFLARIMPKVISYARHKIRKKSEEKRFQRSFYHLRSQGLVDVEQRGKQIYISLTKEGKKKAGKYQIDNLEIKKPKQWDKQWRILIFDIQDKHKVKREALRGKLKKLGLYKLQKSVWVCPYNFQREVEILRGFFFLNFNEMKVITASEIEKDGEVRHFFGLG